MAITKSGGYTDHHRSEKFRKKRQKIYAEERIRSLKICLIEFYKELNKDYDIIKPIDLNDKKRNKELIIHKISMEQIEDFISKYAETKPPGF